MEEDIQVAVIQVESLADKLKTFGNQVAMINRLRRYVAELQKTVADQAREIKMLKTHQQNFTGRALDISLIDKKDDDIGVMEGPLEIPEVLQMIFKHMEEPQVLESRLVCKAWNDSAITIIKACYPPTYHMISEEVLVETVNGTTQRQWVEDLEDFMNLLRASAAPEMMINRLVTDGTTLALAESRAFLQQFGVHVKSIVIKEEGKSVGYTTSLLAVWCINAVELEIEMAEYVKDFRREKSGLKTWKTSLKRLTVKLGANLSNYWVKELIQNSPDLIYFKIYGYFYATAGFMRLLQEFPEITKKLKEVWIGAGNGEIVKVNPLNIFLDFQVGAQLNAITISFGKTVANSDVVSVLRKMSPQLEKLSILRTAFKDQDSHLILDNGFPKLPKLKVCHYLASNWHKLSYDDVWRSMPRLEKLVLAGNYDKFAYITEFDVKEFLGVGVIRSHPNLKHLLIAGVIKESNSISNLIRMFPCIEKLYIFIEIVSIPTYYTDQDLVVVAENMDAGNKKIMELFGPLRALLKLKTLFVRIVNFDWPTDLDFCMMFEPLTTLPSIHSLILINDGEFDFVTQNFATALGYFLFNCESVQMVELVNFKVRLSDVKMLLDEIHPFSSKVVKFSEQILSKDFVGWITDKF